ncbi:hypothetical protein [Mesorhizobium sp. B1-1-8]|uniref:hypothetical protein n=1 Tax=Mesorhizobium sp. B1-1-8 TaxID=2589976 RepID=UPI00112CF0FE|nr:hypothetical protein [Mesorhizobium sp. B1-1-8]UCI06495.1 hypothetical protein FJ974_22165 [Mesorhizobium sp. B1-1-8]
MRFVTVQEPPHDSWTVFDTGNNLPAEYAGRVLIGLTSREAHWFAAAANDQAAWPEGNPSGAQRDLAGQNLVDPPGKSPREQMLEVARCRIDSTFGSRGKHPLTPPARSG